MLNEFQEPMRLTRSPKEIHISVLVSAASKFCQHPYKDNHAYEVRPEEASYTCRPLHLANASL